jgi:hypothetical protein
MTVSRETYIEAWLTCPRKGTSKTLLRTPTCESGFEAPKLDGIGGFLQIKKRLNRVGYLLNLFFFKYSFCLIR